MSLITICALLISTTPQLARSGDVVYNADCKPPDGFTGGTYSQNSLLPIEKCCPQTDPCDDIQGYCTLKWALELYPRMCDHMTYDCRDYQCVCCVKCSEDKCSKCTETRGECKKECRPDEVEDTANPCSHTKCKCCKKCDIQPECQDIGGTCVGSYEQCPLGSFAANHGCCGGCFCCKPECQPLPACSQVEGAYCSLTEDCSNGFYACHGLCQKTIFKGGYASTEKCYCCIPKWIGDYLSACPAENTSTPEYKNPDKDEIDFHSWSITSESSEQQQHQEQPVAVEDPPQTHIVLGVQPTTQSALSSTELLAVDTSLVGGKDGGASTDGGKTTKRPMTTTKRPTTTTKRPKRTKRPKPTKLPLIPIRPHRDQVEKVNEVQEAQVKEVMTKDSTKVIRLSDDEKANMEALLSKNTSSETRNNDKKLIKAKNHINKDQAVETEETPNPKEILKAINLLKKLFFKNKSHKRLNQLNSIKQK